jgi:hypothetical protein
MAAGLGFKTFTTGEVLTAADTNGYLMQGVLVFDDAAARDAAITAPAEGQFAYLKDTDTTTYYTSSAWANLDTTGMVNPMTTTADIIYSSSGSTPARLGIGSTSDVLTVAGGVPTWAAPAGAGLNLISTTTLSTVSSQSVNSVFTSTYTNYLVILSTTATSAAGASITMKLRASGTDSSSTYGAFLMGLNSAGTTTNNTSSTTSWYLTESHSSTTAGFNYAMVNLLNPNLANATLFNVQSLGLTTATGNYLSTTGSGVHDTASAYDGFTIIRSSGTLTGAISVYGYSK